MTSPVPDRLGSPRSGVPASSAAALVRPQAVVETVVAFVRDLHASPLPEAGEPFDVESIVDEIEGRVARGEVDPAAFDEAYRSLSAEQMLASVRSYGDLLAARPAVAPVRVHGSLDLDTLLIDDGRIVGWRPVAVRVGDPYADYACLARSFVATLGPGAILAVFEQLELSDPDPIRLEFWVCATQMR